MIYAAELFLDKASEDTIKKYWTAFSEEGISTYMLEMGARPHVTLAMFQNIDEKRFIHTLQSFAGQYKPFPLHFSSLGVFTTPKACLFLSPVATRPLLNLHFAFHQAFSRFDHSGWEYYLPDQWVPHCALDISLSNDGVAQSTHYMMHHFIPFKVIAEEIGLVKVEKPVTYLSNFTFGTTK